MNDEKLDGLLAEAKDSYRKAPAADLDALWSRIEHAAFDAPRPMMHLDAPVAPLSRHRWLMPAAGIAATLIVGIGIGRMSVTPADTPMGPGAAGPVATQPPVAPPATVVVDPLQRTTLDYLARTVALLIQLPSNGSPTSVRSVANDQKLITEASQLLGTTRILLDSPAASDAHLRDLLEDLELVLAQVARLQTAPRADELTFIAEAVNEREVVPRLRTVAASISAAGY